MLFTLRVTNVDRTHDPLLKILFYGNDDDSRLGVGWKNVQDEIFYKNTAGFALLCYRHRAFCSGFKKVCPYKNISL